MLAELKFKIEMCIQRKNMLNYEKKESKMK